MINIYQGEDSAFYIQGDTDINLETNDFKVLFYKSKMVNERFELLKSDFTLDSINKYRAVITHSITSTLPVGLYIQEVLFGDSFRSISKEESFNLIKTEIR